MGRAQDQLGWYYPSLTAPRSLSVGVPNVETVPELSECSSRQALHEDVRVLKSCRDIKHKNLCQENPCHARNECRSQCGLCVDATLG